MIKQILEVATIITILSGGGYILGSLSRTIRISKLLQESMVRHLHWTADQTRSLIETEEFDLIIIPKGFTVDLVEITK